MVRLVSKVEDIARSARTVGHFEGIDHITGKWGCQFMRVTATDTSAAKATRGCRRHSRSIPRSRSSVADTGRTLGRHCQEVTTTLARVDDHSTELLPATGRWRWGQ